MTVNLQHIEAVNNKAKQLNQVRQQKIGIQQAASQAYERLVKAYELKYGVPIDDTTIQSEYNKVQEDVQKQYDELSKHIADIENGVYNTTTPPQGLVQKEIDTTQPTQQAVQPAQQVVQSTQQFTQPTQQFTQPPTQFGTVVQQTETEVRTVDPSLNVQASLGAMAQQAPPPQPPNAPVFGATPTAPQQQQVVPPVQQSVGASQQSTESDVSEQPFTPSGWDLNSTFTSINGGKPFGQ